MNIVRIDAQRHHCTVMARHLRHEHQLAVMRIYGLNADYRRLLRDTYDKSGIRKTWLMDGRVLAMAFVEGPLLQPYSLVGACFTQECTKYPVEMIRRSRAFVEEVMQYKMGLQATIFAGDEAALRFATFLGFHVDTTHLGGVAHSHDGRVRLRNYVRSEPDLRHPYGNAYINLLTRERPIA